MRSDWKALQRSCGAFGSARFAQRAHRRRARARRWASPSTRVKRRRSAASSMARARRSPSMKSFHSSRFVPTRSDTPRLAPRARAVKRQLWQQVAVDARLEREAELRRHRQRGLGLSAQDLSHRCAAQRLEALAGGAHAREEALRRAARLLRRSRRCCAAPLCRIARRNRPRAAGAPSSAPTLIAPADSPNTVTQSGSPPNASMFSRTQASAASWSRRPRFAGASPPPGSRSRSAE